MSAILQKVCFGGISRLITNRILEFTIAITILIGLPSPTMSQDTTLAIIRGVVKDSASASPLENAIIYIANSPLGTSSARDGSFFLKNVPYGEYDLIVSRVNYQQVIIPLKIDGPGLLEFSVKLSMKLVLTPEVEIVGADESKPWTPPQYFPINDPEVIGVYGTGSTVPIAVLHTDSALYMLSLDVDTVDEEKYVRLWMLYLNLSETPFELNPAESFSLSVTDGDRLFNGITPERAEWLRPMIDSARVSEAMSSSIQVSLESMAVQRSAYLYSDRVFTKLLALRGLLMANQTRSNDRPSAFAPATDATLSGRLYSTYINSVNVGLIGRHLVYPGNSVRGFVYFPNPGLHWQAKDVNPGESTVTRYEISIRTNSSVQKVVFLPN